MFKIFVALIVLVGIISCNGKETVFIKNVQNDTSKEITLYFFGDHNPNIYGDTVIIPANTTHQLFSFFEENSSSAIAQPCEIFRDINDTVSVEITGGNLKKSFYDANDWDYINSDNEQICTFVITNADI